MALKSRAPVAVSGGSTQVKVRVWPAGTVMPEAGRVRAAAIPWLLLSAVMLMPAAMARPVFCTVMVTP